MRIDEFAYQGNLSALRKYSKLIVAAIVLFTLAGGALFTSKLLDLNQQINDLEEQILDITNTNEFINYSNFEDYSDAMTAIKLRHDKERNLQNDFRTIYKTPPQMLEVLYRISDNMPSPEEAKIDVTNLKIVRIKPKEDEEDWLSKTTVTIDAKTTDLKTASMMESALKQYKPFTTVKKDESVSRGKAVINIEIVEEKDDSKEDET